MTNSDVNVDRSNSPPVDPTFDQPIKADSEVLIIGAGPAGCAAAITLARAGRQVRIIDQHTFPRDKVCGDGLIPDSLQALEALGVLDTVLERATLVKGLACHGPAGGTLHIPGKLAVLPRRDLDMILVRKALDEGAEMIASARFNAVLTEQDSQGQEQVVGANITIGDRATGSQLDLRARWVILATGAAAGPLKAAQVCERSLPSAMALRTYVRNPDWADRLEHLEISWHRSYAPGYGWVFPAPDGLFNVGVGLYGMHNPTLKDKIRHMVSGSPARTNKLNLHGLFERFVQSSPRVRDLVEGGEIVADIKGAPLRCSLEGASPSRPGMLVTGEALGSTYALTGEGIGKAMETGMLAAQAILSNTSDQVKVSQAYQQALDSIRPKFAIYQRANIINQMPWLINLAIRRGNASPRLVNRMSLVLEEKANPARLFTFRGAWKFLTE
ncbi:geranylgeranyl reductase [Orrella marina]|uniref:Geranylgeranyl reductase n=2 Tax=Orrella marina TaxID=2163011 RepID=A0A2R4XPF4_9BURK|nr:geranylgeranyl reductase [Orrella marina]